MDKLQKYREQLFTIVPLIVSNNESVDKLRNTIDSIKKDYNRKIELIICSINELKPFVLLNQKIQIRYVELNDLLVKLISDKDKEINCLEIELQNMFQTTNINLQNYHELNGAIKYLENETRT